MVNIKTACAVMGITLCFGISTASWGAQPIQNVNDAAVVSVKPVGIEQVKNAIMIAGTSLGWQMAEVSLGLIQAR